MARFRNQKVELARICAGVNWKQDLERYVDDGSAVSEAVSPLLALLPRFGFTWQAAYGLGLAVSRMAARDMESARIVMRRLMWSMNEESGNLGWGIPEAMGCILAESAALAKEYGRILLSYGHDTGREDNFIEHAPLRRGVYWGIGRLAASNAAAAKPALPQLIKALGDKDAGVRTMAAFALGQLAAALPAREKDAGDAAAQWREAERALEETAAEAGADAAMTDLFDGQTVVAVTLAEMSERAVEALKDRDG